MTQVIFKLRASQKKLLNEFIDKNLDKIDLGFDVIKAVHAGWFPVDLLNRLEEIKDGDFLQATLNNYVADRAYTIKRSRI